MLVRASISPASARTFTPGIREYLAFCESFGINPLAPTQPDLEVFVAHLSVGRAASTVQVYLSAVRHYLLCNSGPVELLRSIRIRAMVKGIERAPNPHRAAQREAITLQDLAKVSQFLATSNYCNHDRAMLWAATTVGFYGLLRAGEFTAASTTAEITASTLTCAQAHVTSTLVQINLKVTKTSQNGDGGVVTLHPSGGSICPVSALNCYLTYIPLSQRNGSSPLFRFADGRNLTRDNVTQLLRSSLRRTTVSSHSLRIGGATLMAATGATGYEIQVAGRWQSQCYVRYVRQNAGLPARLLSNYMPLRTPSATTGTASH